MRFPALPRALSRPALLVLAVGLSGCRACDNDRPYVPPAAPAPAVAASVADAGAPETPAPAESGALVEPALVAPPASTRFEASGMVLEAGGREIALALVRDFDGDGKKDALAIVRPPLAERRPGSITGELVYFRGTGGPPTAVAAGPKLGVHPSCAPAARLEKIGPRSAFAEIGGACPRGAGSRAIVVVRLPGATAPDPAVAFDALVLDPREAPKLTIDVDAADRDDDGIDDVVLRVALEGGGASAGAAPRVAAKLAFFDRPAGPSRDRAEPDASLRALAAQAASRASKAKDAASVPPLVEQLRALYRAMCIEGGAPRITEIHGGSAASCGTSKPLEDAGVAEVRALVTQGDALRAFAAAEIAQLAPATKTAVKTKELDKLLAEIAPVTEARSVRVLGVVADAPQDHHPEWGPLAFEYTGKLLVRNGASVVRIDPETGDEQPADMVAWGGEVLSPDGKTRWLEAYHACEGVALHATLAGEGDMSDVLLPIAPRLHKTCNGGRGEPAPAVPIAWGPRGLEALVAGQPVLIKADPPEATALPSLLDETPPPGSPRSHAGKTLALATPTGVLVRGRGDKWSTPRSAELEPYSDLRRCTIDDDASHVACLRRGKVLLATLP